MAHARTPSPSRAARRRRLPFRRPDPPRPVHIWEVALPPEEGWTLVRIEHYHPHDAAAVRRAVPGAVVISPDGAPFTVDVVRRERTSTR